VANYEELYNLSKSKFDQTVELRNGIREKKAELRSSMAVLQKEIGILSTELTEIRKKLSLIKDARQKCQEILEENGDFVQSKQGIFDAGAEYKSSFQASSAVADLAMIYDGDIASTKKDLDGIFSELERMDTSLTSEKDAKEKMIKEKTTLLGEYSSEINSLSYEEAYAQKQINFYYGEMEIYKKKMAMIVPPVVPKV